MQMKEADVSVCSDHWIRLCPRLWLQQWFLCFSTLSWQVVTSPNFRRSFIICIRANLKRLHHLLMTVYFIPVMSFSILNIHPTNAAILRRKERRVSALSECRQQMHFNIKHTSDHLNIRNTFPTDSGATKLDPCQSAHQGKQTAPVSMDTFLPWCYNTESQIRAVVHFSLLTQPDSYILPDSYFKYLCSQFAKWQVWLVSPTLSLTLGYWIVG